MIGLALWRFLCRTPWSTLMAILGVALAVTSIVSVHLISTTVARQLEDMIPPELGGYSHFLHRDGLAAADYFQLRRQWLSADRQHALAAIDAMAPVIDETATIHGQLVRVIGIDLLNPATLRDLPGGGNGQEAFSWQGVWVDAGVDDTSGMTVNGRLDGDSGIILADIGVAQRLLGWDAEQISYIGLQLHDPWRQVRRYGEQLLPGFGAGLPAARPMLSGLEDFAIVSLAQQHPASQFGKSVLFNISALGLLAMLVAWFLMYQVAVSWLRRLWPVFERLHVLGVAWSSLGVYFVAAMCALGLFASSIGLLAGRWVAEGLFEVVVGRPDESFVLSAWVVGKAVVSALAVCLLGGLWAFRQARVVRTRVFPLGLALLLVGLAVLGVAWQRSGLLGGFTSIAVCSVLAALFSSPLLRYLRGVAAHLPGPYLARLSIREAVWYPRDLAVALSGLALAIATAIGVGLMVDSFREDFSRMLERRLSYDLVVRGTDAELRSAQRRLAHRSDVHRLQSYRQTDLRLDGVPLQVVATRFDARESARYGLDRALARHEVLLSEQGARSLDKAAGQDLLVAGSRLRVVGVFASFGDVQPRMMVADDNPLAARMERLRSISLDSATPRALADELLRDLPGLKVELQGELRRTALYTFDQTFVITTVLIFIAMLVAAIGVYVAVTTLRLNRRSSLQLMTGLGLSRYEEIGMDFALGVGVGVVALLLAIPLGTLFGWILCAVINPRAFGWSVGLQLSWSSYALPVAWGLVAAAVAGTLRVGRGEAGRLRGLA